MSRNTYIIILVLVALGIGLFFVMNTDSGQSSDGGDMATTTPDTGDSAKTTDDELKVWLEEYGMNTPEDIGFPTTAEESDFVPPEGWVKYTFDRDDIWFHHPNAEDIIDEFLGYHTDDPSSFQGFEFWYPGEFVGADGSIASHQFEIGVYEYYYSLILHSPLIEKHGPQALSVFIDRITPSNNEIFYGQSYVFQDVQVLGRKVKQVLSEDDDGVTYVSYYFEVGPYRYSVGFGVEGSESDSLYEGIHLTYDDMTREEVFQIFFNSFRFIDSEPEEQKPKLIYPE